MITPRLTRLYLHTLCLLSRWIYYWIVRVLDNAAVGSKARAAEAVALKSKDPKDAEHFAQVVYARAALLPELCHASVILGSMLAQVQRRHAAYTKPEKESP